MYCDVRARVAAGLLAVFFVAPLAAQERTVGPPPVESKSGLVVSVHGIASDVGASILRKGGNAVDAAVATAFALAVVHPSAGNIGGGGYMIVRPTSGAPVAIDYREVAPAASTPTMYLDSAGNIIRQATATGYLAPGVPGTVAGLELAHKKYGKLPWKDVVMPAVTLAEAGFPLSESLARSLNREVAGAMARYPASVKAYGKPGGGQWKGGDTLVLKDLARSLRAIAIDGAKAFYSGWISDSTAAAMKANGGLIRKSDLATYTAKERTPVRGTYRGYEIISMPPSSSGGIAMIETLNILENFDLKSMGRNSVQTQHLLIESMRRAFLDRARYLGDPDFVKVPVDKLISKDYAKTLAQGIDRTHASSSVELGKDIVTPVASDRESEETTHFSVVDKDGMSVSNTFTLEGGFGSHVVVSGAGYLLNNEMGDFNKKPGDTNAAGDIGTEPNLIAPGKRMLSSMSPAIVTKGGQLFMVTGSPGGRTIINTVFETILNATEFGMNVRDAVDAPRVHHQWLPDAATFERNAIPDSVVKRLEAMGHTIKFGGVQGDAHSIIYDAKTKTAYGANDTRSSDSKVGKP
jgi:gamma-glutamyltranspeptidase / glutathione hydrolase